MGIAYLLAWSVRRVAAVRHAILLTGLVAAIVVPRSDAGHAGSGSSALAVDAGEQESTKNVDSYRLVAAPCQTPADSAVGETSVESIIGARIEAKEPTDAECLDDSLASVEAGVTSFRAPSTSAALDWQFVALPLAAIWLVGALVESAGLGISVVRLRRIVARARLVEPRPARSLLSSESSVASGWYNRRS